MLIRLHWLAFICVINLASFIEYRMYTKLVLTWSNCGGSNLIKGCSFCLFFKLVHQRRGFYVSSRPLMMCLFYLPYSPLVGLVFLFSFFKYLINIYIYIFILIIWFFISQKCFFANSSNFKVFPTLKNISAKATFTTWDREEGKLR